MSKTGKLKIVIYSLFACLLIGTISILHTSKVKAYSQEDQQVFIPVNSGYSLYTFTTPRYYDYYNDEEVQVVYSNDTTTGYSYWTILVPSDNPLIYTIFLSYNCQDLGSYGPQFSDKIIDNQYIFECGFYNGANISSSAQKIEALRGYYLPYKVPALSQNDYQNKEYENLSYYLSLNTPFSTEGYAYFVVRAKTSLISDVFGQYSDTYEPFVWLTDLDLRPQDTSYLERYNYDNGYSNGYDDGLDYGRDVGYDVGYQDALADSSNNLANYNNVLQVAWNGASSFLNTKVFGDMTILHLLLIPLTLGVLIIIIKLVRG